MRATGTLLKYSALVMNFLSLNEAPRGHKVRKVPSKDHSKSTFKSETRPRTATFFKKVNKFFKSV